MQRVLGQDNHQRVTLPAVSSGPSLRAERQNRYTGFIDKGENWFELYEVDPTAIEGPS